MSTRLDRFCGASMALAGCSVALWALLHPWGTIAGPEVGASGRWAISHTFHFFGGLFGSVGLLGLVGRQMAGAARLEQVGFFVAFVGTVMYTATGVITAFVWPLLAVHAPSMTELAGPIFSPPHPVIGITALLFSLGYILLSVALARAGIISTILATVFVVGALLLVPPPPPLSPMPWLIFPVGGLLFGVGMVSVGIAVIAGRARAELAIA